MKKLHILPALAATLITGVAAQAAPFTTGSLAYSLLERQQEKSQLRKNSPRTPHTGVIPAGAAALSLPNLSGSVVYSDDDITPDGVYKLPRTADAPFIPVLPGVRSNGGGVFKDGVWYSVEYKALFGFVDGEVFGYDALTGDIVFHQDPLTVDCIASFGGLALNPVDNEVYGITFNADGNGYQLSHVTFADNVMTVQQLAPLAETTWYTFSIDAQGQFYAIHTNENEDGKDVSSTLCKIDRDGNVTEIGLTGDLPEYGGGACIDPETGRMFWCVDTRQGSRLDEVNLTTGVATKIYDYPNAEEIMGMCPTPREALPGAPAQCGPATFNFTGGNLTGTASLTAPATLYDGSTPTAPDLTVTVLANGTPVGSATGRFGQPVNVPIDLTTLGNNLYNFVVYAENSTGRGAITKYFGQWVGFDAPVTPEPVASYAGGKATITWPPVTTSVHNGYVDWNALTYTITLDGNQIASGLTVNTFSWEIEEPVEFTLYDFTVTAVTPDIQSETGSAEPLGLGAIYPPYQNNFDDPSALGGFTILNANNDTKTWGIVDGAACIEFNVRAAMDDWLITPAIHLEPDGIYNFQFTTWSNAYIPERLEVKIGTEPTAEAMTGTVVPRFLIQLDQSKALTKTETLQVEAPGNYYIGFHGISDINQYYLYVDNLRISGKKAGVGGIADTSVGISATGGVIRITSELPLDYAVYDTTGRAIFTGHALTSAEIPAGHGLFIVRAGNKTLKTTL